MQTRVRVCVRGVTSGEDGPPPGVCVCGVCPGVGGVPHRGQPVVLLSFGNLQRGWENRPRQAWVPSLEMHWHEGVPMHLTETMDDSVRTCWGQPGAGTRLPQSRDRRLEIGSADSRCLGQGPGGRSGSAIS